jgi:hypothetical protein
VKADVFRLAYLTGIRKEQLRRTRKRHVLILGDTWKLRWPKEETKNRRQPHEVVLGYEEGRSSSARGRVASPTATSSSTSAV